MSKGFLTAQAHNFAEDLRNRRHQLERGLETIEKQKFDKERLLEGARQVDDRYATFEREMAGKLLCPKCWIYYGNQTSLQQISGSDTEEVLRCNECKHQYHNRLR
jgi:hypothetical protein